MTDEMPKDQTFWNIVAFVIFIVLFVLSFLSLTDGLRHFHWLYLLGPFDIAILSLATFRVIRLVTFDKITAFARNWFLDLNESGVSVKPTGGFRRTIAELQECLWCTGLWAALLVATLYFSTDMGRFLVVILALAAIGSLLQNASSMVGRIGNK